MVLISFWNSRLCVIENEKVGKCGVLSIEILIFYVATSLTPN